MASRPVMQDNRGGLNKDNEPSYVNQGDYVDALNVRAFTSQGQTTGAHENIVGNEFAFDLGSVNPSSKTYRVCGLSPAAVNTGWEYFGAPTNSFALPTGLTYDPHIIEDFINPSGGYILSAGYDIWIYDPTTNEWTKNVSMTVDTGVAFKSVRLYSNGVGGDLYCSYVKNYGSGNRYVVKKWNGASWDSLTNNTTGFEAADGYTFANKPGFEYLAHHDPYLIVDPTSNVLYLYIVGVYYNPAESPSSILYDNIKLPRVFQYNGSTWDDISSISTNWSSPDRPRRWTGFTGDAAQVGAPAFDTSGYIYFPACIRTYNNSLDNYTLYPYAARLNTSTGRFNSILNEPDSLGAYKTIISDDYESTLNFESWASPTMVFDTTYGLFMSYGFRTGVTTGLMFVLNNPAPSVNPWSTILNSSSMPAPVSSASYLNGKVAMASFPTDLYVAFSDYSSSEKLTVIKYNMATSTWSFMGSQGISNFELISKEIDIVYHSVILNPTVSYSDYSYASGYAFYVGVASVQTFVGAGTYLTGDFKFSYGNGVEIDTATGIGSMSDMTSFLSATFDPSKYLVTTSAHSRSCLDITIQPITSSAIAVHGWNYFISTSSPGYSVTVIQDALPVADSGASQVIGSDNIGVDLFILSTPNDRDIISDNVYDSLFTGFNSQGMEIHVPKSSDIIDGSYVRITNSVGSVEFSGEHLCSLDTTQSNGYNVVTLLGYFPSATIIPPIQIRSIAIGYGEIGVAIRNDNTDAWSYTRLVYSSDFKFSTKFRAEVIAELNNRGKSLYWTDNNSPLRSFYYYGEYQADGGFNHINSLNRYRLGAISDQVQLQRAYAGADIFYVGQGVGKLKHGNYRYTCRFVTNEGIATAWIPLSSPFSVFDKQEDPYKITGKSTDTDSNRSNIFSVTWSDGFSYDFIEFAYVLNLFDTPGVQNLFSSSIVKFGKTALTPGQVAIQYEHNGYETDIEENYPSADLAKIPFVIKRAKNIKTIDNSLVVSNVNVGSGEGELFDFFNTFKYSVEKHTMTSCGSYNPSGTLKQRDVLLAGFTNYNQKKLVAEEYMNPENVFKYTGYMMNERYRFYGVAELNDGSFSEAYHLFDVKIDTDGYDAINNPKRINGLSDFSINSGFYGDCLIDTAEIYVPYVNVVMPDVLPTINGVPASDVIKKVYIYRADVKNETILYNGIGVMGNQDDGVSSAGPFGTHDAPGFTETSGSALGLVWAVRGATTASYYDLLAGSKDYLGYYFAFPFIADIEAATFAATIANSGLYLAPEDTSGTNTTPKRNRKIVTFFSADTNLTDKRIKYVSGDSLINYGQYDCYSASYADNDTAFSSEHRFGSFYLNSSDTPLLNILNPGYVGGPVQWVRAGEGTRIYTDSASLNLNKSIYTKLLIINSSKVVQPLNANFFQQSIIPSGYIFLTSADVSGSIGASPTQQHDYGANNISYYRALSAEDQYGDPSIGRIIPTGAFYDLRNNTTNLGTPGTNNHIKVFGGDTFTCKTVMKYMYGNPSVYPYDGDYGINAGNHHGVGIEFYSQSRVNPQLRYNSESDQTTPDKLVWPFDFDSPEKTGDYYKWFASIPSEDVQYNPSYSDKNNINVHPAYNPDLYYENLLPASIFYSNSKLQESVIDAYAYIAPTNRKDLDITHGRINHMEIWNGNLITFQDRKVQRQYFNSTTMLQSDDPSAMIALGDAGAKLSRRGSDISSYGLANKWAVVKGRSGGGNDVLYWFDAVNKKFFRLGADGVVPISSRGNIDSFLAQYTKFCYMYDMPAFGLGVHGVWDESNNEVVFTFRAQRDVLEWVDNTFWPNDIVVRYDENVSTQNVDWHQTGEMFRSLADSNLETPSIFADQWSVIPHTDPEYYNEFTIVFSEDKNKFTTFYSPRPKIYLPYRDTYLSPRPIHPESKVYEHNKGVECVWYALDTADPVNDPSALKVDAYIEGVINMDPELIKTAEAISIDANTTPTRVDVTSATKTTHMTPGDFAFLEDMYRSAVKNDTSAGGTPDGDSSTIYGRWFKVKYTMAYGAHRRMRSFILKVRGRARSYNR